MVRNWHNAVACELEQGVFLSGSHFMMLIILKSRDIFEKTENKAN